MKIEIKSGINSKAKVPKGTNKHPSGENTQILVDGVDISHNLSFVYFEVHANDGVANWYIGTKKKPRWIVMLRYRLLRLYYRIKRWFVV